MKFALPFFSAVLTAVVLSGCRVRDIERATLTAPGVCNEACAKIAEAAIRKLPGNDKLAIESIDYATGKIVVRYDSMKVGTKNLEYAIAEAGFAAGPFPANAEAAAKLPPECRVVEN